MDKAIQPRVGVDRLKGEYTIARYGKTIESRVLRPWELLPLPKPSEYDPGEEDPHFFYNNFANPITKDFIRIMNNGLTLDRGKVEELKKVVTDIVASVHDHIDSSPIVKNLQKHIYPIKFAAYKAEVEASMRTLDYYIKPYSDTNVDHRTYVVNARLLSSNRSNLVQPKWTIKLLKNLAAYTKDIFFDRVIDKDLTASETDPGMQLLAKTKLDIWNKVRTDKTAAATQESLLHAFNPGSSNQLRELFEFLEIEPLAFSAKTKEASWGRDQIEEIFYQQPNGDFKDLLQAFIDYSYANIIKTNFMESFEKFTIDNVLHGVIRNLGAKTMRPTSNSPNLLNMPSTGSIYAKPLKKCFVAPPGYLIWSIDYSALEDRVIANLSGDKNKLSVFTQKIDGHSLGATYYFKEEVSRLIGHYTDHMQAARDLKALVDAGDTIAKSIRQKGKPVTFGISYGAYPPKIAATIKCSLEEAMIIFDAYHNEMYPDITLMRNAAIAKATEQGYLHMGLGARIYSDDIKKDGRTLFNSLSQFWSYLTLISCNELHHQIDQADLSEDIKVNATIYDALYGIVKNDAKTIKWLNDTICPIMEKDFMENQIVSNEANLEIGTNWGNLIELPQTATATHINMVQQILEHDLGDVVTVNNERYICSMKIEKVAYTSDPLQTISECQEWIKVTKTQGKK